MTERIQSPKDKSRIEETAAQDKPVDNEFRPSPELAQRLFELGELEELSKESRYIFGPGSRPEGYQPTKRRYS